MTEEPPEEPQQGSMRFQDAESAKPREPTLAEQRARRKALADEEQREAELKQAEEKAASRRKVLIGGGVTTGLVGVVAAWYLVGTPKEVEAVCTDSSGTVVADNECDESYATSHGGYYNTGTGFWFVPLPGGGWGQYRYNYGGTGVLGGRVAGGTYTAPSG